MELRQRKSHVSGELGMSSMTDIIFILLMFFMMTSTLTAPSALPLDLPGKSRAADRMVRKKLDEIAIKSNGTYLLNGRSNGLATIEERVMELAASSTNEKANIIVSPDGDAPVESVVTILDLLTKTGVNAVLNLEDTD